MKKFYGFCLFLWRQFFPTPAFWGGGSNTGQTVNKPLPTEINLKCVQHRFSGKIWFAQKYYNSIIMSWIRNRAPQPLRYNQLFKLNTHHKFHFEYVIQLYYIFKYCWEKYHKINLKIWVLHNKNQIKKNIKHK